MFVRYHAISKVSLSYGSLENCPQSVLEGGSLESAVLDSKEYHSLKKLHRVTEDGR